jgi:hypothetical protein
MKTKIAALIAGIVLGSTGAGIAATTSLVSFGSAYGVKCYKDTSAKAVYCGKSNGTGYFVGISSYAVVVNDNNGHSVLKRFQP